MFPANGRWTAAPTLRFFVLIRDKHSSRRKIRVRNIHEHDVRRFGLGPRFFHQPFRDALDNFALLIDRAPRQPCNMHIRHFVFLLVRSTRLARKSGQENRCKTKVLGHIPIEGLSSGIESDSKSKRIAVCYASCHRGADMPKFLIEREILGAAGMSQQQLQAVSEKSCSVLRNLGPEIQWVHSYVTGDKIYCVYIAPNEQIVREHARLGGFPANRISEIKSIIDPTTAEKT